MPVRQAGQLAVAVGSPVPAEEHQEHPCVEVAAESPRFAGLVFEGEVGYRHRRHYTAGVSREPLA